MHLRLSSFFPDPLVSHFVLLSFFSMVDFVTVALVLVGGESVETTQTVPGQKETGKEEEGDGWEGRGKGGGW